MDGWTNRYERSLSFLISIPSSSHPHGCSPSPSTTSSAGATRVREEVGVSSGTSALLSPGAGGARMPRLDLG